MVNDDKKLKLNVEIAGEHSEIHENSSWRHSIQLRTFEKLLMRVKFVAKVGEVTVEFNLCDLRNGEKIEIYLTF